MTKKNNILAAAAVVIAVIGLVVWLSLSQRQSDQAGNKPKVAVSIYPLAFVAERVGGERIELSQVVPGGAEPHDFEPTARDLAAFSDSDLAVVIGSGLEPWAERSGLPARQLLIASESLPLLEGGEEGHGTDPHVWLAPKLLGAIAAKVGARLSEIDPAGASYYDGNLAALQADLSRLDEDYRVSLSDCGRSDFISSHAAFAYLASAYGLRQVPIAGLEPEAEPSPRELTDLAKFAKDNDIHYIFFETMVSPELAKSLADEVGAATLVLNPLEGLTDTERASGSDYLSEMRNNLNNLRMALECR